jgi:hypothetical protein
LFVIPQGSAVALVLAMWVTPFQTPNFVREALLKDTATGRDFELEISVSPSYSRNREFLSVKLKSRELLPGSNGKDYTQFTFEQLQTGDESKLSGAVLENKLANVEDGKQVLLTYKGKPKGTYLDFSVMVWGNADGLYQLLFVHRGPRGGVPRGQTPRRQIPQTQRCRISLPQLPSPSKASPTALLFPYALQGKAQLG